MHRFMYLKKLVKKMERFKVCGRMLEPFRIQKNYWQQDISKRETLGIVLRVAGMAGIKMWLFYQSFFAIVLILPFALKNYREQEEEKVEQKKREFLLQFQDMIQSMAAALGAGYSVENSIREAQKEMRVLYGKDAKISKELVWMVRQMRIQIPMEQIFEEFAQRVDLEDVKNFATVFRTAKRSGGNMLEIIQNTVRQIGDKMDVKREIDTILAAKSYEFKVMSVIPYIMIGYMLLSFPEFMSCLYGNIIGIGVMSICFVLYEVAYSFGKKLIRIDV